MCNRVSFPAVYPMGNGTSRLYSALAKTLNSSAASQHPEYLVAPDPEHLEPIDPKELLEECRAVLHTRPPRFQRDFVALPADGPSSHPPIRVMQWNILAQGRLAASLPELPPPPCFCACPMHLRMCGGGVSDEGLGAATPGELSQGEVGKGSHMIFADKSSDSEVFLTYMLVDFAHLVTASVSQHIQISRPPSLISLKLSVVSSFQSTALR